jgi:uncharacterized protein YecE (DUF72 family)
MQIHVGTSGFSYKEWKGSFYPEDLKNADMLRFYAERFSSVEINNTFYRMPKAAMLEGWAGQVPPGFLFVLKASQQITHRKRLREAGEPLDYLLKAASVLGERLGPVLFQLPPSLRKDVVRLRDFLALLPEGHAFAFEFRHETWADDEVRDALRERNAALVCAPTPRTPARTARRSCPPPTGATCACAGATTRTPSSPPALTASAPSPGSGSSSSSNTRTIAPWPGRRSDASRTG